MRRYSRAPWESPTRALPALPAPPARLAYLPSWQLEAREHLQQLRDLRHVLESAFHVVSIRPRKARNEGGALRVDRQLEANLERDRRREAVRLQRSELRHRPLRAVAYQRLAPRRRHGICRVIAVRLLPDR